MVPGEYQKEIEQKFNNLIASDALAHSAYQSAKATGMGEVLGLKFLAVMLGESKEKFFQIALHQAQRSGGSCVTART